MMSVVVCLGEVLQANTLTQILVLRSNLLEMEKLNVSSRNRSENVTDRKTNETSVEPRHSAPQNCFATGTTSRHVLSEVLHVRRPMCFRKKPTGSSHDPWCTWSISLQ